MPFIVLPGGGNVAIIGQKTHREKLGIDVMAQGRQDDPGMERTASFVGESNGGAVLSSAIAVRSCRGATRQAP